MSIDLLAALDWSPILWWIDVVLKVAIGLGALIFVHELGHFLAAKACGVKIEKFMIGFDIGGYRLGWRRGETLYGIGILPLGGYVKMFGQDDDPAHIAEQMQKSQIDAASSDAVPIKGPKGETYFVDRRSYLAKSVPQRMAIISAGVIMNVIFAFIFAVIAFGMGVPYMPSIVSQTVPGSPAWEAGIEPGDEIVRLGDRENPTFMQLMGGVTLGDLEEGILLRVKDAEDGTVREITLKPKQLAGQVAKVGIAPPMTLTLAEGLPFIEDSAAAEAKLVEPAGNQAVKPKLQGGDTIVRVGDVPVKSYREFSAQMARRAAEPVVIVVRRSDDEPAEDQESGATVHEVESAELRYEVPPQAMRELGLVMKMGPITAVQSGSPADIAGLVAGDRIELVDGEPIGTNGAEQSGWTPASLPNYLRNAAVEGREVEFTVRRGPNGETRVVRVQPTVPLSIHSGTSLGAPMGADAVGIAYRIENEVQAVAANGPAAESGIASGDLLLEATITRPAGTNGEQPKPVTIELGRETPNLPALLEAIQFTPEGTKVELRVQRGENVEPITATVTPQPAEDVVIAARGFVFEELTRIREAETFADQVRLGFEETVDALTVVFRFLQKLGTQVPITMLGGPGTIAMAAGASASQGLPTYLMFLTLLSANLAVLNFLPIPLLDGGHMVFLAYEGIRGRPASERFVLALHTAGFVFIIGLMVFVIGLDIQRWLLT